MVADGAAASPLIIPFAFFGMEKTFPYRANGSLDRYKPHFGQRVRFQPILHIHYRTHFLFVTLMVFHSRHDSRAIHSIFCFRRVRCAVWSATLSTAQT